MAARTVVPKYSLSPLHLVPARFTVLDVFVDSQEIPARTTKTFSNDLRNAGTNHESVVDLFSREAWLVHYIYPYL